MVIQPTLDAPPLWSHLNAAVDTLDNGGLTATDQGEMPGTDTISVSVSVGGKVFSTSQPLTVSAAPQELMAYWLQLP